MTDNTQPEDRARLEALLEVLAPNRPAGAEIVMVTHYGAPVPWARARARGGVFFKDKRTRAAAADLEKVMIQISPRPVGFSNIALALMFYMPTRHVLDADNLTKLVKDAATKAHVWEDDSQVTAEAALVEYCGAQPRATLTQARTVIAMVPMIGTLDRTVPQERRRRPSLPVEYQSIAGR